MDKKGITLIEMLITFSMIAVLASLAFSQINVSKLNGAVRMIFSDLHYARLLAIRQKNNVRVIFGENGHSYKIHNDLDSDGVEDAGEHVINKDVINDFNGVSLTVNANPTFTAVGLCNAGTITLSEGTKEKEVVFSWTGRIKINVPVS